MKQFKKMLLTVATTTSLFSLTYGAFGDEFSQTPDPYQNSGYQNISYDVKSKFYAGATGGIGLLTASQYTEGTNAVDLSDFAFNYGIFAGYKFNDYFAVELAGNRLAGIDGDGQLGSNNFNYSAAIYNINANVLGMYPVYSSYYVTVSPYLRAGYGVNFTPFDMTNGNETTSTTLVRGGYNAGAGVNVDFRFNVSMRLEYDYYQVAYNLGDNGTNNHGLNTLNLGLYYNF